MFSNLTNLYAEVKKRIIEMNIPPVTDLANRAHDHFGLQLYSRYQRQGHVVKNEDLYPLVYGSDDIDIKARGFFSTNCQIANFSLLNALSRIYPNAELTYPTSKIYFESEYILRRFGKIFDGNGSGGKICFIDSAQIREEEELYSFGEMSDCFLVVFDTTCFDRNSPYIKNCVSKAQNLGIPIVLTRSHLKLDTFGTEYFSLGSCLFVGLDDERIFKETYDFLSHVGGFALFEQICPFMFDQKLKAINSLRVEKIRENTQAIYKLIEKNPSGIGQLQSEYLHALSFVYVYNRDKVDFVKTGLKFNALCELHGIAGKFCDSFGFDFFSLTNVDSFDENNNGFLRFCSPVNHAEVEKTVKIVNQLLHSLQRKE